jgi:hypothetical protein
MPEAAVIAYMKNCSFLASLSDRKLETAGKFVCLS